MKNLDVVERAGRMAVNRAQAAEEELAIERTLASGDRQRRFELEREVAEIRAIIACLRYEPDRHNWSLDERCVALHPGCDSGSLSRILKKYGKERR